LIEAVGNVPSNFLKAVCAKDISCATLKGIFFLCAT